ncbi:hypothetical protein ACTXT7_007979 [Hymenolepis weldensis]
MATCNNSLNHCTAPEEVFAKFPYIAKTGSSTSFKPCKGKKKVKNDEKDKHGIVAGAAQIEVQLATDKYN